MKLKNLIYAAAFISLVILAFSIPESTPIIRGTDPLTKRIDQTQYITAVARFDLEQADSRATVGVSTEQYNLVEVGTFKVTWYNATAEQCGNDKGITKSGVQAIEGVTVSTDWSVLPAGTEIYVEGIGWRIVEDTGSGIKGNELDVYCEDYDTAMQNGVQYLKVYITEVSR